MKLYIFTFNLIFLLFIAIEPILAGAAGPKKQCVVIDAGHGGKDFGASYAGIHEKDINLAIALFVGQKIKELRPDVKIVYTRSDDTFVELGRRCQIANQAEATLFVSIHTNANAKGEAYGTETFVMGVDKAGANLGVAMRENGVITLEQDYSTAYQGYDPNSSESFIIFSLMQYSYQQSSLQLASMIQKNYANDLTYTKNRGVKQAGFLVLWQAAMPSVLTEVGFVSNKNEAQVLKSEKGRRRIANSLACAIGDYLGNLEGDYCSPTTSKVDEPTVNVVKSNSALNEDITFFVQACTSSKPLDINSRKFGRFTSQVQERKMGKVYKYFIGGRDSYKEVLLLQSKVRELFPDAFCVAFRGSEPIAMDQARKLRP